MSTNNFYYNNILYAVDEVDDNGEIDEFIVEDTVENVKYDLLANEKIKGYQLANADERDLDENRNFYGRPILEYETSESVKYDNKILVQLVVRAGYYSGANFNVNIVEYDLNGYECTTNDTFNMTQKQRKELDLIMGEIEKTLGDYTTKLDHLGTFSNGEAIYQIAK
jgi:hypothetical protein